MRNQKLPTGYYCLLLVTFALAVTGCRTVRMPFAGSDFEDYQRQLVGRHYPEANRVLGPHLPVWVDSASGERYLRYRSPDTTSAAREFYLARVSDRDVIVALSRWNAAGEELAADSTVPGAKTPLLGSTRDDASAGGGRSAAVTFTDAAPGGMEVDIHPSEGDLWGRPRVLMVECDEQGVRRRARYFTIEGEVPTRGFARKASPSPSRPTMAARVDLFVEPPPAVTKEVN